MDNNYSVMLFTFNKYFKKSFGKVLLYKMNKTL